MIYPQRVGFFLHLQDLINDYLVGKSDLVGIEIGSYAGESASMFLKKVMLLKNFTALILG